MNRELFLEELERQLQDLTEEERAEALRYYRELFAETAPDEEEELLRRLGSPETVAAELREGLRDEKAGAGSGETAQGRPDPGALVERGRRDRRRNGLLLLVLFLVFGLPIAGAVISAGFSVAAGLAGCLLGVVGGLLGLIFAGFVTALGLFVSGIALAVIGIIHLASPPNGLMLMSMGFLMLSAAMFLSIAVKWGGATAVPGVVRFAVGLVRRFCRWVQGLIRRMFGRGGAAI